MRPARSSPSTVRMRPSTRPPYLSRPISARKRCRLPRGPRDGASPPRPSPSPPTAPRHFRRIDVAQPHVRHDPLVKPDPGAHLDRVAVDHAQDLDRTSGRAMRAPSGARRSSPAAACRARRRMGRRPPLRSGGGGASATIIRTAVPAIAAKCWRRPWRTLAQGSKEINLI